MMASSQVLGRKAIKKSPQRSFDIPDRLRDGPDAQDDVTAPKGSAAPYSHQSVFSMIAAAGRKRDFNTRFDEESSEDEAPGEADRKGRVDTTLSPPTISEVEAPTQDTDQKRKHRRKLSEHKLLRSLPKLSLKGSKERKSSANPMTQSQFLPPKEAKESIEQTTESPRNDVPVMSQILKAEQEMDLSEYRADVRVSTDTTTPRRPKRRASTTLAERLKDIFGFDAPEEVISEYPCWLLQSVLLQGYMYITQKHICFYAYLPKKSNVTAKSGYLSKRGKSNPKYNRYWFVLKGDVLTYYSNPANLYFPSGHVDLRYGISAALTEQKDKSKDCLNFSVTTAERSYQFKADSASSAKEWVKQLNKVIFRSHNDGDSVKISMPTQNVIDIEENAILDFADTVKIRVIDNDETYAIDEYFFSFFSFGKEALNVLRIMVEDNNRTGTESETTSEKPEVGLDLSHRKSSNTRPSYQRSPHSAPDSPVPALRENVRATLSPISPTSSRASGEYSRSSMDTRRRSYDGRRSIDALADPRRSASEHRHRSLSRNNRRIFSEPRRASRSPFSPPPRESSESIERSQIRASESSAATQSADDHNASGSQILSGSVVFQHPTLDRSRTSPGLLNRNVEALRRDSLPIPASDRVKVHPPVRTQTGASTSTSQYDADIEVASGSKEAYEYQGSVARPSQESTTIEDLRRASRSSLDRAGSIAGYLRKSSKRMSNLLATESMGYYEKVSGMWAGGKKHYGDSDIMTPEDHIKEAEDDEDLIGVNLRFRKHFALGDNEELHATYFAYLHRVLPLYGKIYISKRYFCFRSLLPGTRTKLLLPLKDVENVTKEKGFRYNHSGLVLAIRGHEELFFEFSPAELRDDCAVTVFQALESAKFLEESGFLTQEEKTEAEIAKAEHQQLQEARQDGHAEHELKLPKGGIDSETDAPPVLFDDPRASILNFKPTESLRITCLTIGSRGDVQPYIALCKGLLKEGHKPKIATHAEFEPWVRKHGIDFAPVEGDPAELMRICVENGMFTISFFKEATSKFRGWLDSLFTSSWKACQNSDLLIESPSAMGGIHIAEALGIPYWRAFTMPWTRTRAYPHAFAVPERKMGGAYNYMSYLLFDNVFWKAIAGQVNRWRKTELGLPSTSLEKLQPNKIPFLYNFSPSVVVPPLDYSDWIRVTGYWFLDEGDDWKPPSDLTDFIAKARKDGKKLIYVGFGSIVVEDPKALTKTVVDSVIKADVRCILSKGWSDRLGKKDSSATAPEVPLPESIFQIKSAPHDWLFRQIDAAAHHGGAGTTGASLRAGIPTIIKPFFGDQFFFGSRVEDLGVGICMRKVNTSVFARAMWEATHSQRMIVKARLLGESIRKEDGVGTAIQAIYRDMEYAKSLIKKRQNRTGTEELEEDFEESWTFIGDESDPDLSRRIVEWQPKASKGLRGGPIASGLGHQRGVHGDSDMTVTPGRA
ncbi:glycosyltransferase family 1 protein [Viridothelium virens]|uniref:Sterol 3-beta-glucosyltransferase n=1 Tax=Viridothelium virens TaxID=1048519 RepID=A0A6A6H3X7_VIRVR|nr:glycosyltransferase family 1 protein [Viridothelium virens]